MSPPRKSFEQSLRASVTNCLCNRRTITIFFIWLVFWACSTSKINLLTPQNSVVYTKNNYACTNCIFRLYSHGEIWWEDGDGDRSSLIITIMDHSNYTSGEKCVYSFARGVKGLTGNGRKERITVIVCQCVELSVVSGGWEFGGGSMTNERQSIPTV